MSLWALRHVNVCHGDLKVTIIPLSVVLTAIHQVLLVRTCIFTRGTTVYNSEKNYINVILTN